MIKLNRIMTVNVNYHDFDYIRNSEITITSDYNDVNDVYRSKYENDKFNDGRNKDYDDG